MFVCVSHVVKEHDFSFPILYSFPSLSTVAVGAMSWEGMKCLIHSFAVIIHFHTLTMIFSCFDCSAFLRSHTVVVEFLYSLLPLSRDGILDYKCQYHWDNTWYVSWYQGPHACKLVYWPPTILHILLSIIPLDTSVLLQIVSFQFIVFMCTSFYLFHLSINGT